MKNKAKIILTAVITFLITLTITVTASLVTSATNITYTSDKTNKTNVNDSLDELYDLIIDGNLQETIIKFVRDLEWNIETSAGNTINVTEGEKYVIMMASTNYSVNPTITGATLLKEPIYESSCTATGVCWDIGFAIVEATSDIIIYGNTTNGNSVIASFGIKQVENIRGDIPDNMGLVKGEPLPVTSGKVYLVISSEANAGGGHAMLTGGYYYNSNENIISISTRCGINFAIVKASSDSLIYKSRSDGFSNNLSYIGYVELF